jgi:hypothetical protein
VIKDGPNGAIARPSDGRQFARAQCLRTSIPPSGHPPYFARLVLLRPVDPTGLVTYLVVIDDDARAGGQRPKIATVDPPIVPSISSVLSRR